MKIGELTREAVVLAVEECDRLGSEEFLRAYGFEPARRYVLVHAGRDYDSTAVAGVAHRYCQGRALRADEFGGGRAAAAGWLRRLGFDVRERAREGGPDWVWDELVLACALLADNDWARVEAGDERVIELSELLRKLPFHPEPARGETFRDADDIADRIGALHACHASGGGGESHRVGRGTVDHEVLHAFLAAPATMAEAARRIRSGLRSGELLALPEVALEEEYSAPEGRILARRHLSRERDHGLRERKLAEVLAAQGHLSCVVCDFDFEAKYGAHGAGYIECHHVVPLHEAGDGATALSDLTLVCANCHRMVHRANPWLTIEQLRALISK